MISIDIKDESKLTEAQITAKIAEGTEKALMALALMGQANAQRSILSGAKTGHIYKRGLKFHQASAPGEAPANDLGFLVANIKADMSDQFTANLRSTAPYSIHLEYGTINMAARPFLGPAGDAAKAKAKEVFDAYVGAALK